MPLSNGILFKDVDFSLSSDNNTITWISSHPVNGQVVVADYGYPLEEYPFHEHAHEERSSWPGGSDDDWVLAQIVDPSSLMLHTSFNGDYLWITYSSFGSGSDLLLRRAAVDMTDGSLITWDTDGVLCNASGNPTESPTVLRCMSDDGTGPCFLATVDGTIIRVYRVDDDTLTSVWSQDILGTGYISDMYVCADGTIYLAVYRGQLTGSPPNEDLPFDGVWRSTDGGATFSFYHRGHSTDYREDGGGAFDSYAGLSAVWVDEVRNRIWTGFSRVAVAGFLMSRSDDGVVWVDTDLTSNPNSIGVLFTLSGSPYRDGDRISLSFQASVAGGLGIGYITTGGGAPVVTMLTEFKAGSAANSAERAFFDDPTERVLIVMEGVDNGEVYTTADSGDTWTERQDLGGDTVHRGISMHATNHAIAAAIPSLSTVAISLDRGVTFNTFDLPATKFCRLVAWANGY